MLSFILLNKGLQYYEPLYLLPLEKVSLIINNLLCGGILLHEFNELKPQQIVFLILGAVLCVIGVIIFIWK